MFVCLYVCIYITKDESIKLNEIFERGKQLIIHDRHTNLKYKQRNRSFWRNGYNLDTAGRNTKKIVEYIKNNGRRQVAGSINIQRI